MEVLERLLIQFLLHKNLHPFSVLYFTIKGESFLKISFYLPDEIEELKNLLDYRYFSDRSGWLEYKDSNTILLRGMILNKFLDLVEQWEKKS